MNDSGCRRLAKAVVVRGSKDYMDALRQRNKNKKNGFGAPTPNQIIRDCERFFKSSWCDALCSYAGIEHNGREIMEASRAHVERKARA